MTDILKSSKSMLIYSYLPVSWNENFTNCKTVTTVKVNTLNLIFFDVVFLSLYFRSEEPD